MSFETLTPNMSLPVPGVGLTDGPQYAIDLNACMTILDAHNHSSGNGVQITPSGLNINADIPINGNNLTGVKSTRFTAQNSTLAGASDLGCVYSSGVDLYFNDGNGNAIRITQNGAVSGTPGSIANLVSPASAAYVAGTNSFVWQSGANTAANMDMGAATMRNITSGSYGLTVQPPSLAANATLTLPIPPASNAPLIIDSSGNITAPTALYTAFTPTGAVLMWTTASAPSGYLLCDGTAVSRSTYSVLYGVIGITHGQGDGSTTFNVPDYRGRFIRGVDGAAGRDPDSAGRTAMNTGGNTANNVGSVQGDAFASHTHIQNAHTHLETVNATGGGAGFGIAGTGGPATVATTALSTVATTATNQNTGGSTETRPINAYVNFIIKY